MSEPTAASRTMTLLPIGVLVIALAAVFLVGFQVRDDGPRAAAAATPGTDQPTGVVTGGIGTAEGTPDQVRFTATVTNQRASNDEAVAATNHDVRAVIITLKKNGVAEKDIQTASLNIEPKYGPKSEGGKIVGYTSTQRVKVLLRDLAKAGVTFGGVTAAAGNAVRIGGLQLSLSNQDDVIAEARAAAVEKSKAAAAALAEAAGRDLGELVYVEEVVPQGYPQSWGESSLKSLSAAFDQSARRGSVPVLPGQQEFSITVNVRWSLA